MSVRSLRVSQSKYALRGGEEEGGVTASLAVRVTLWVVYLTGELSSRSMLDDACWAIVVLGTGLTSSSSSQPA
jgi:hypothetical protein